MHMWKLEAFMSPQNLKILLIAPDNYIRNSIRHLFKTKGIFLTSTESGSEGLGELIDQDYYLIIFDDFLWDMDGLDFLKRAIDINSNATKILMTTFKNNRVIATAEALGIQHIIEKPVTSYVIESVLSTFIEETNKAPK